MLSRLDLAVPKDCDGVNPDSIDGFDNDNGIGLTQADAWDHVNLLTDAAHAQNLSRWSKEPMRDYPVGIGKEAVDRQYKKIKGWKASL